MNNVNDKLKLIENAADSITDSLAENYNVLGECEKEKILSMSERKLNQMKRRENINAGNYVLTDEEDVEIVEIPSRDKWYRNIWKAAACFVCVTAAAGAAVWLYSVNNIHTQGVGSTPEISSQTVSMDSSSIDNNGTDTAVQEIDSNIEDNSDEDTSTERITCGVGRDEDLNDQEISSTSVSGEQSHYGDEHQEPNVDVIQDVPYDEDMATNGYAVKESLLSVTPDMTYGEVISRLGVPDTLCITEGYAQFIIDDDDGDRLLMLFYDNEKDTIGKDGKTLYEECVIMSDLFADVASCSFEGIVVSCNGMIRVTCPQYLRFDCADLSFIKFYEVQSVIDNVKPGDRLFIKHKDEVLDIYPSIIYVEELGFSEWVIDK